MLSTAYTAEQKAKATYDNVIARYGDQGPFGTVSAAEAQHIATLNAQATNFSVTLPGGPFTGQAAPATFTAACQLGVTTEQGIITMYDQLIPQVAPSPNLTQALDNLRAAAQDNHLPAFQKCA